MAVIGVKHLVYAPITEKVYGQKPTYGTGAVLAKLTKVDRNITNSNTKLYADDATAEVDHRYQSGTLSVGTDDFTHEAQKGILGNKEKTEDTVKVLTKGAENEPPEVGVGFITTHKRNNIRTYEACVYLRVMFSEPNINSNTKGENIEFQTPELEADIMEVEGYKEGAYEELAEFTTEAAAITWLDNYLNVSSAAAASYMPATYSITGDDE